ncbi:N-acetyltransferase [Micromonospora profundi]|uniref:N-acetyltransferase n=1 Tax=Micromonospora profundi TaxID=1420889 RepID=A0AAJ6L2A6_9ACTN|nr:N-acetyltransferase [Micromonospora profundi]WLS44786.1 N-acetyltransferase [Micromonospora profundi]
MHDVPRIRAARWTDKGSVAALIADVLYPSTLAAWLVPDQRQRLRILADVLEIWVEHAMFYGDIHVTDDLSAATVGFHRYRPIPPPANYPTRLTDAAGPHAHRFELLDQALTDQRPTEPHYHLAFLAVATSAQHTRRGSAILHHHRSRLDRIDLPSWTATTSESQHLYTRYGYTDRPAITLPDGPVIRPMRRNPNHPIDTWPATKAHHGLTPTHDHNA